MEERLHTRYRSLPRIGSTESMVLRLLLEKGALHMTILDTAKCSIEEIGQRARLAEIQGSDLIAVGGTLSIMDRDENISEIKKQTRLPVLIFPSNVWSVSRHADAILFISLINSRNPYYISGAQIAIAPIIQKMKLEVIPVTYLLFEPGRAAGWVSDANLIPRDSVEIAQSCALAGEYQGAHFIMLSSGSGGTAVPPPIVRAVKEVVSVPIIVGGGIRTPDEAQTLVESGADIVDTGTIFEETGDMTSIVRAVREGARKRMLGSSAEQLT